MSIRERLTEGMRAAMKAREPVRLSTFRLINAAVHDRDIALRSAADRGSAQHASDDEIRAILAKMVRQRHESARAYEEGGRLELAEKESFEISVIEELLPRQLTDGELDSAITAILAEIGASSIRDLGAVMSALKDRYTGRMDFAETAAKVKARLA